MALFAVGLTLLASPALVSADPSWASLPVNVPRILTDDDSYYPEVPVYIGEPEQELNLTINLSGSLFAPYSSECVFCPGPDSYDLSVSTTVQNENKPWQRNSVDMGGSFYTDSVDFGHILFTKNTEIMVVDHLSQNFSGRWNNGNLGIYMNSSSQDDIQRSFLTKLYNDKSILNPVVGLRLDANRPRMTIGALDPADYEGTINWVQMETPATNLDWTNAVKIDGVKGYNGSFLPFGSDLMASINSLYGDIAVPPSNPYALDDNYTGPQTQINLYPTPSGGFAYKCNWNSSTNDPSKQQIPPVYFTVTINGVDYPMDDMIRPTSGNSAPGFCNVALRNSSITTSGKPDITLGQPFLRSVYLAYRFPTDSCPGYYGFAFLSNSSRTQDQINQKPTATPTLSSQCLNLITPTSTPKPQEVKLAPGQDASKTSSYWVYGRPGDGQVPLLGIDELPRGIWNRSVSD